MKNFPFGTISHGTMRNEDLIPTFTRTLESLATESHRLDEFKSLIETANNFEDFDSEEASDLTVSLFEALHELAPPNFYFGAHVGDGTDYGFWSVSED